MVSFRCLWSTALFHGNAHYHNTWRLGLERLRQVCRFAESINILLLKLRHYLESLFHWNRIQRQCHAMFCIKLFLIIDRTLFTFHLLSSAVETVESCGGESVEKNR